MSEKHPVMPTPNVPPAQERGPDETARVPGATPLTPGDWRDLLRDVAEAYDEYVMARDQREAGERTQTGNDVRALADYLPSLLTVPARPAPAGGPVTDEEVRAALIVMYTDCDGMTRERAERAVSVCTATEWDAMRAVLADFAVRRLADAAADAVVLTSDEVAALRAARDFCRSRHMRGHPALDTLVERLTAKQTTEGT